MLDLVDVLLVAVSIACSTSSMRSSSSAKSSSSSVLGMDDAVAQLRALVGGDAAGARDERGVELVDVAGHVLELAAQVGRAR